jgi:hypothetical protein
MNLVVPLSQSISGVVVAAVAYVNRDKPEWQRDMRKIYVIAIGQVALGVVALIMLGR